MNTPKNSVSQTPSWSSIVTFSMIPQVTHIQSLVRGGDGKWGKRWDKGDGEGKWEISEGIKVGAQPPGWGCESGPKEPAQLANYLLKSADFCRPSQQTQQIQLGPEYVMAAENTLGKLSCQTLSTTQCRVNTMHINKLIRDWHSMGAYCHNPGQPKTKSPGVVLLSVM